jgi:acyl-CoA reductase-like NAD-dependent aldehyde dehydrogenase
MSAVATSRGAPDAMLVGADWVPARDGRTFEVANPATGDVLAYMPEASTAEVEAAVAAAAAAFPAWSGMDAAERGRIMCRFADLLEQHGGEMAQLETADNGRPIRETRAQGGIVAKWYRYYGGMADKVEGATIPVEGPYLNYTRRVPVGGVCRHHPLEPPQPDCHQEDRTRHRPRQHDGGQAVRAGPAGRHGAGPAGARSGPAPGC